MTEIVGTDFSKLINGLIRYLIICDNNPRSDNKNAIENEIKKLIRVLEKVVKKCLYVSLFRNSEPNALKILLIEGSIISLFTNTELKKYTKTIKMIPLIKSTDFFILLYPMIN